VEVDKVKIKNLHHGHTWNLAVLINLDKTMQLVIPCFIFRSRDHTCRRCSQKPMPTVSADRWACTL